MKLFGVEYLETPTSRVWRRASVTMRSREALEDHAKALAAQEGWHQWRVVDC